MGSRVHELAKEFGVTSREVLMRCSGSISTVGPPDGHHHEPATGRDVTAELAYLTRALKAPTLRESVTRLAERARAEDWTHEEYLAACLQREVSALPTRPANPTAGGTYQGGPFPGATVVGRVRLRSHPRTQTRHHRPSRDPGLRQRQRQHRFSGPAGHRQDTPRDRAGDAGVSGRHRVLFATAAEWVARLAEAHKAGGSNKN
ncbi:MAG: hypothetical protein QOF25_5591 [Mycobacterium sp.]|nr:hypothetical protein [Mycobacterium sp.]